MLRTAVLRATESNSWRKPMIQFLGKNRWGGTEEPTPHKQAPQDVSEQFDQFREKLQAGRRPGAENSTAGSETSLSKINKPPGVTYDPEREGLKPVDYEDYWEAPERLWRKVPITELEMALVESGGAETDPAWLSR